MNIKKIFVLAILVLSSATPGETAIEENHLQTRLQSTTKPGPSHINSLGDLCSIFEIPPSNCTCDQFMNDPRNAGMYVVDSQNTRLTFSVIKSSVQIKLSLSDLILP